MFFGQFPVANNPNDECPEANGNEPSLEKGAIEYALLDDRRPCHSIERPILWRAVPDRSNGFLCVHRGRRYNAREIPRHSHASSHFVI